jgi:hypothetical protein
MHKQFFTCALLLLVRQNLTSKSDAQAIFHMCTTFAGFFFFFFFFGVNVLLTCNMQDEKKQRYMKQDNKRD